MALLCDPMYVLYVISFIYTSREARYSPTLTIPMPELLRLLRRTTEGWLIARKLYNYSIP